MTCKDCAYFNAANGECRRNAPFPVGHRQYAQWPKVKDSDWCGQFEAAAASDNLEPIDYEGGVNAVAAA